jgi:NDP-sugar pyrophosphorylase family protein
MEAFLLAAGLGTRLRPLTEHTPKPLIEILDDTLLGYNLKLLSRVGVKKIVVNTHYLHRQIEAYLGDGTRWGVPIEISYEPVLLDTGGGLKKAWDYFSSKKILTWNSDIILDPGFVEPQGGSMNSEFADLCAVSEDESKSPVITILVRNDTNENLDSYGSLGISDKGRVVEFLGKKFVDERVSQRVMFAGISIMDRRVSHYFPQNIDIFSTTKDLYPQILMESADKDSGGIWVSFCTCYWNDVGTIDRLNEASKQMKDILSLQR